MSAYKHKSGCQKRKEKEVRKLEASKGQTSLSRFLKICDSDSNVCATLGTAGLPSPPTASSQSLFSVTESKVAGPESETLDKHHLSVSETKTTVDPCSYASIQKEQLTSETLISKVDKTASKPELPVVALAAECSADHYESEAEITLLPSSSKSNLPSVTQCHTDKYFDVGSPNFNVEIDIKKTHEKLPITFPEDSMGFSMPTTIFKKKLANGELVERDWLVWSKAKAALFCLPCKIFSPSLSKISVLASAEGWSPSRNWRKLHARVPEHEKSETHRSCYLQWKCEQLKYQKEKSLSDLLSKTIKHEQEVWRGLLRRLLDVTLFLAERGLAFRGSSDKIGDCTNGNFLGILELLAKYDPLLNEHLQNVRHSQETGKKIQVSYLSPKIQNEFIDVCGSIVRRHILKEREEAKYFSLIVDATPDSAHIEQTAFLIRYVHRSSTSNYDSDKSKDTPAFEDQFQVHERLIAFVDCSKKTGEAIYELIKSTLSEFNIPVSECRGQGYDNGSNMKGAYKGVQARMLVDNDLAIYSACACHSLNLCGEQAAASCREADTFFGVVQKLYNLFSSSPQRWEILQKKTGCSLHSTSETRWSAKVESVKPIAAHLPSLVEALDEVLLLNLSAESRRDIEGLKSYMKSLDCLLLSSIWFKILKAIDMVNRIIQARGQTLSVANANIRSLVDELQSLREEGWEKIWKEVNIVAENIGWPSQLNNESKRGKKRKRMADEEKSEEDTSQTVSEEVQFKRGVYNVILDEVISDLRVRFESMKSINDIFSVLWEFNTMAEDEIKNKTSALVEKYKTDLQEELVYELESLNKVYSANFGKEMLSPLELLNRIYTLQLANIFPNICIALRIFLTIPATVASAERSFSTLKRVKNVLRSTMTQNRLTSLGLLAVEAQLAKTINMDNAIEDFAAQKARKKTLH